MSDTTGINQRLDKIDDQLDKLVASLVKGFKQIDEKLEQKADSSEIQKILSLLMDFLGVKRSMTMKDLS